MDDYLIRVEHAQRMHFWLTAKQEDRDASHAETKALRRNALFKRLRYTPPK